MNSTTTSVLALCLVLAGCAQPSPDVVAAPTASVSPPQFLPIEASDCLISAQVFPTTHAAIAAHLPPGYRPTDLSAILDVPVEVDRSGYAFAAISCGDGPSGPISYALWLLLIETPSLAARNNMEPNSLDVYALAWYGGEDAVSEALRRGGLRVENASVMLDETDASAASGVGSLVSSKVNGDNGSLMTATTAGLTASDRTFGSLRTWTETASGTVAFESQLVTNDSPATFFIGATQCTIENAPAIADGRANCMPNAATLEPTVGANVVAFSFANSGIYTLPGQFEI